MEYLGYYIMFLFGRTWYQLKEGAAVGADGSPAPSDNRHDPIHDALFQVVRARILLLVIVGSFRLCATINSTYVSTCYVSRVVLDTV